MAHPYSRVTHRPAVLMFAPDGHLQIVVAGHLLGLFAGLKLPRKTLSDRPSTGSGLDDGPATDRLATDRLATDSRAPVHGVPPDGDERLEG